MDLDHFGGTFGGNRKPTPFMCLILKMLQIQPEKEIVVEFIKNSDYKYVRLLGAFYLRLVSKRMDVYQYLEPLSSDLLFPSPNSHTCHSPPLSHAPPSFLLRYVRLLGAFYLRLVGKPMDVYQYLEPLYNDYRKVRRKLESGTFVLSHVDEFIEELLTLDSTFVLSHVDEFIEELLTLDSSLFVLSHVDEFIEELLTLDSSCDITSPPCSPITPRSPPSTLSFPLVFVLSHVDEFIEELLTLDSSCDIALPRIPRRWTLEAAGQLELRKSGLDYDEMEEEEEEEEEEPEPVADK
ncbi:unnamed protein product, partial [Closterium sp. Naga37s-1]